MAAGADGWMHCVLTSSERLRRRIPDQEALTNLRPPAARVGRAGDASFLAGLT